MSSSHILMNASLILKNTVAIKVVAILLGACCIGMQPLHAQSPQAIGYADNHIGSTQTNDEQLAQRIRYRFVVSGIPSYYRHAYGGYVLFEKQMKEDACLAKDKRSLVFMDHEGGSVNRLHSALPAASKALPLTPAYLKQWSEDALQMNARCVDAILGPAVDANLGSRSLSEDTTANLQAAQHIEKAISASAVGSVVKHFPGKMDDCYQPDKKREVEWCQETPQQIEQQWTYLKTYAPAALMVSHYSYKTSQGLPAAVDPEIFEVLTTKLNYQGLLITDALWELSQPVSREDLDKLFLHMDLIMHLDAMWVERHVPYLVEKVKSSGEFLKALERAEEKIRQYKLNIIPVINEVQRW